MEQTSPRYGWVTQTSITLTGGDCSCSATSLFVTGVCYNDFPSHDAKAEWKPEQMVRDKHIAFPCESVHVGSYKANKLVSWLVAHTPHFKVRVGQGSVLYTSSSDLRIRFWPLQHALTYPFP